MAKDKSRKDISPGKKPGPLTKKERKERKKKRKEKHPKWLFLHLFTILKNPGLVLYMNKGEGDMVKDKSRKDISPGKKPGPLAKKERRE